MGNQIQATPETLHITTDVMTAKHLESALGAGVFLAWQDALYEGPIDAQANLSDLSLQRAQYFSNAGWAVFDEVDERYTARNLVLFSYQQFREIVLWFDHDLNSQLQLVQLIEWFSRHPLRNTILSLVSVDRVRGASTYRSLNMINQAGIKKLMSKRWEVTLGQMNICQHAWNALGSSNPNTLLRFYNTYSSTMPHIKNAILRLLKQYPSQINGLSHSELLISNILLQQKRDALGIYQSMQSKEAIAFMNPTIFANCLQNMSEGNMPLVIQQTIELEKNQDAEDSDYLNVLTKDTLIGKVGVEQKVVLKLTDLGRQVLHNWVDWVQVNGINRWLGGVHLKDGNLWRYDESRRRVIKTYV